MSITTTRLPIGTPVVLLSTHCGLCGNVTAEAGIGTVVETDAETLDTGRVLWPDLPDSDLYTVEAHMTCCEEIQECADFEGSAGFMIAMPRHLLRVS